MIERISSVFRLLGQPNRLRILLAIGNGDVCVCHLEAGLGLRQAYISQQLMLLRDAGLVNAQRAGKHIFYTLADASLLSMVQQVAGKVGLPDEELTGFVLAETYASCVCPKCHPEFDSQEPPVELDFTTSPQEV